MKGLNKILPDSTALHPEQNKFQTQIQFCVTDDRHWVFERLTSNYLTQLFQLVALLGRHTGEQ